MALFAGKAVARKVFRGCGCAARTSFMLRRLSHAAGELLGRAFAADVHEVDLRLVEEEVIVQGGDPEAVFEGGSSRGLPRPGRARCRP